MTFLEIKLSKIIVLKIDLRCSVTDGQTDNRERWGRTGHCELFIVVKNIQRAVTCLKKFRRLRTLAFKWLQYLTFKLQKYKSKYK